jgi:hypothetical protein
VSPSPPPIEIDWSTASVRDGRLTVAFTDKPSAEWSERLDQVIERLQRPGVGWGAINVSKKRLRVDAVEPGAESDLRHLIDSAVLQANADRERDEDDERDVERSERSERDQAMTDAFRSFAPDRPDADQDAPDARR